MMIKRSKIAKKRTSSKKLRRRNRRIKIRHGQNMESSEIRSRENEMMQQRSMQNSFCVSDSSLAMVYSPPQDFDRMYSPENGLQHGTMFMDLYKPIETAGEWEVED